MPGLADQRQEVGARVLDRPLDDRPDQRQLDLAADERAVRAPPPAVRARRGEPLDGVRRHRPGAAADGQRSRRHHAHQRLDGAERPLADQHLAGLGGLLEAGARG